MSFVRDLNETSSSKPQCLNDILVTLNEASESEKSHPSQWNTNPQQKTLVGEHQKRFPNWYGVRSGLELLLLTRSLDRTRRWQWRILSYPRISLFIIIIVSRVLVNCSVDGLLFLVLMRLLGKGMGTKLCLAILDCCLFREMG